MPKAIPSKALSKLVLFIVVCSMQVGFAAECKVEDWKWKYNGTHRGQSIIRVEGTTTCKDGVIRLRVYDDDDKLIGTGGTFIRGFIFHKDIFDVSSDIKTVKIKYEISDR